MKKIVAFVALALTANWACGQDFHIQLDGASFSSSSGPMVFTLANAFDEGLPVETEHAVQAPTIQQALELTDEQVERIRKELQAVSEEFQPRYDRAMASTDDNEEKNKLMEELRAKHREAIDVVVDEILLPHQSYRLKQLKNRGRMQTSLNSSEYNEFEELLNLTADQKKQLAERSAEMREKLKVEIRELKQRRSQEVLESVLTKEQRAKLQDVLGDPVSSGDKH